MYLIVGLGNPGKEYENTRHNTGFRVLDMLSHDMNVPITKSHSRAFIGQGEIEGTRVILAKPQTFMNLSGESVSALLRWHKMTPEKLVIIHDDLDLEVGVVRIRAKGASGGHNGIESIINSIGTSDFTRIKVGIGREALGGDNSKYVLSDFTAQQKTLIDASVIAASDAARMIVTKGLDAAINTFNSK